jgi:O-antigen/teichoic acid export membrane protein
VSTVAPAGGVFVRLKEAAGHTVVYGLGSVAQTLVGQILLPLYAHYFAPAEFGILSLITLVATLAGAVFYLGSSSALARSYFDYDTDAERRRTVTTALLVTLSGALLQIGLGFAVSGLLSVRLFGTPGYRIHLALALTSSAVTFVNGLFLVVLRFERRSVAVVATNIGALIVTTACILWMLFGLRLGLLAPILGGLVGQTAVATALAWLVRHQFAGGISRRELGIQIRFGLGALCIGAAYYVLDSVDRLILNRLTSLADVGVYSLGYRIGMLIHVVFILPFAQIWSPMRMEYRHDAGAPELFKLILTYYWMVGLLATVLIGMFAREIVAVAGSAEYQSASRVVPVIMLSHLVYGVVGIVDSGIIFSRRLVYQVVIFTAGALLNIGLNLLLIPRWGYMAAAYVTLFSYVAVALAVFIVSNRFHRQEVERLRLGLVMASGLGVLVLGTLVSGAAEATAVAGRLGLIGGLAGFWYLFVLSDRERRRLQQLKGRFV